ncbi:acid protease [Gyrodon lividus]|nr:acid protease [Gyrodon lividus]
MLFTFSTAITALPLFVAVALQRVKEVGTAIEFSKRSALVNTEKSVNLEAPDSYVASTRAFVPICSTSIFCLQYRRLAPVCCERASGGLPLDTFDVGPHLWFGTVSIGTPPLFYTVVFDTGSSDLILPGVDCDDSCYGHAIYNPASSSTSVNLCEPFAIEYGTGDSAFGHLYTDNVTIVGLTATDQTLGVASHYSQGFKIERFDPDGVMGMGFQSISQYHQSSVFQTFVTQGQTDEPVFAFNFAAPEPELYIGGTNRDMYIGDFTYSGHRTVVNGEVMLTNVDSIIDTGTDLIHGLPEDVATFYEAVGGGPVPASRQFYAFPCDAVPSVSFIFGGTSFPISVDTFIIGSADSESIDCYGAIIAGNSPFWIVGAVFLSNVYIVFDVANARVGFATLA